MSHSNFDAHSHPLFQKLNLLKLNDIYYVETCKFMYMYMNNMLPLSFNNLFKQSCTVHAHNTRQALSIRAVKPSNTTTHRSLLCRGPNIWNSVNIGTKNIKPVKSFVSAVRRGVLLGYRCPDVP